MENNKPKVKLLGKDGNIFNLMGICSRALRKVNQEDNARLMLKEVQEQDSYENALNVLHKYCEIY